MPADPEVSITSAALAPKDVGYKVLGSLALSSPKNVRGPASKKSGHRLRIWVLAVAAVAIASGVSLWLYASGGKGNRNGTAEATLTLETFVVNLDGSDQRAYLRVGITLGFSHNVAPNSKEELPIAALRDAILSVLSTARADHLLTRQGKEQLKGDLFRVITERVPQMGVLNIYFTEFLVQM